MASAHTLACALAEKADLGMAPAMAASPRTWMPGTKLDSKVTGSTGHHWLRSATPASAAMAPARCGGITLTTAPVWLPKSVVTVRDAASTSVTLPLIRDNVQTAYIYLGILALDAFVYMAALNPGGGPNNSTLVMAQQLFTTAFTKGQFGLACAMGVVLAVITLATLMAVLDASIVNIALPQAQAELSISDADRHWAVTAYALAFGGLLLLGGRVADFAGRKRAFIVGLVGFAAASTLGGFADNAATLFGARALQGVFAALLAPAALSLVAVTFTEPLERARAFGVYGAVQGGGGAVGLKDWRQAGQRLAGNNDAE